MKSATGTTKKLHATGRARASKTACGTLSYLAECRGASRKARVSPCQVPPADIMNRIAKQHPAGS